MTEAAEKTEGFREQTAPLLRPHEVESRREEAARIERIFSAPAHIQSAVQNKKHMRQRLAAVRKELETQSPKEYVRGAQLDAAKRRHDLLLEEIQRGMPTQEEMRRRPAGAVDKYRSWVKRNKEKVLEIKNIRLRLHASGDLPESNIDANEVANLERFRPSGGAQELNMDNELIQGKEFHQRPPGAGLVTVMSEEVSNFLLEHDPDLHKRMGALTNRERAMVIERIEEIMADHLVAKLKADPAAPARAAKAEKRANKTEG